MDRIESLNNRSFYISFLNVFSSIAVVILHANGAFWAYRNDYSWAINNFIECVFYFAVPVFFMIIGVTLLDYTDKYDTKTFFKKRVKKIVLPYIFWTMFALLQLALKDPQGFLENELKLDKIFNGVVSAGYVSVYWFFIPLIYIYINSIICQYK